MWPKRSEVFNVRVILAAFVLLIGAGAAAWSIVHMRAPARVVVVPSEESLARYVWSDQTVSVREHGPGGVADAVEESILTTVARQRFDGSEAMASDLREMLFAWTGGSAEQYLAFLRDHDTDPPSSSWKDPEKAEQLWEMFTKDLRGITVDPSGVRIVDRYTGDPETSDNVIPSGTHSWRYDKLSTIGQNPTADDPAIRSGIAIKDVVLPVRLRSYDGNQIEVQLGMGYAWDKGTRRWVLVRVSAYDIPNGEGVILPPF